MTSYKERELRLITEMENRTEYNDGLTIVELCKRILDYQVMTYHGQGLRKMLKQWPEFSKKDYDIKHEMDRTKIMQIRRLIKRTREKYRTGTKYNDTDINKHQYYLLPPRLLQKDRRWRCVHIIKGVNGHLLDLRGIWFEKKISGMRVDLRRFQEESKELERIRLQGGDDAVWDFISKSIERESKI